jgi:hypothetical protein
MLSARGKRYKKHAHENWKGGMQVETEKGTGHTEIQGDARNNNGGSRRVWLKSLPLGGKWAQEGQQATSLECTFSLRTKNPPARKTLAEPKKSGSRKGENTSDSINKAKWRDSR